MQGGRSRYPDEQVDAGGGEVCPSSTNAPEPPRTGLDRLRNSAAPEKMSAMVAPKSMERSLSLSRFSP